MALNFSDMKVPESTHTFYLYLIDIYTYIYIYIYILVCTWILFWIITLPRNVGETCQFFNKKAQLFTHNTQCSSHLVKCHTKFIDINKNEAFSEFWYCPYCRQTKFPYNYFKDDVDDFYSGVIEGMLDCSFRLHEINSNVFITFEINDSLDTHFSDIDPDDQYNRNRCRNGNINCDWLLFRRQISM